MAADSDPIDFRGSARVKVAGLALGCLILVGGILMILDQGGSPTGYGFFNQFRPLTMGWLVAGLGIVTVVAAALALSRGCPTLQLDELGISYKRCLRAEMRIGWAELDRAEIERRSVPGSAGNDINLESVVLVTTSGRRIGIAPLAPAVELQAAIARRAAYYKNAAERGGSS